MNPVYGQSVDMSYPVEISAYPVDVQFPPLESPNKLYAIPILGYLVKMIILIPHLVILYLLHAVVGVLQYILWIPVLFSGRYPSWGHQLVGGTLSWTARVYAYMAGLSDAYPAFSLADPGNGVESQMLFQPSPVANRLYAVPVIGFVVKFIMLIPHLIILYVLGLMAALALLVTWIPVLFAGQYPQWGRTLVGGWIRWFVRVNAFWYGLTDAYPPFQLN